LLDELEECLLQARWALAGRLRLDLVGGLVGDQPAAVQDDHAVGDGVGLL
jgi:hypothetical protein